MRSLVLLMVMAVGLLAGSGVARAGEDDADDGDGRNANVRRQMEALHDMESADTDTDYDAAMQRFEDSSRGEAARVGQPREAQPGKPKAGDGQDDTNAASGAADAPGTGDGAGTHPAPQAVIPPDDPSFKDDPDSELGIHLPDDPAYDDDEEDD